jgi:hypothetical protein
VATFTSIFVPGPVGTDGTQTVGAASAGTAVKLGNRTLFAINATADINIIFFNAANVKTPTASNFRIPSGVVAVYDLSDYYDSFNIYSTAGAVVYWQTLNRG